jgi:hypothetical protein
MATAAEIKFLDPIWGFSQAAATAFAKNDADTYKANLKKIGDLVTAVAPDAGGNGNFAFINKVRGTILSADTRLQSNAAIEEARAAPTQTQTAIAPPTFQRQILANVRPANEKQPVALVAAILKDPEEIQWGPVSSSSYPLQVSLAGLTLSTQSAPTAAGDAIGWAFNQTSGSYINDNTNLDTLESSATALYNVGVSEVSVDGQTPTYSVLASTNGVGKAIYNGSPVDDATLAIDLMSDIVPGASGLLTFNSNAIFTVNIPLGTTGETLLFPNDVDLGLTAVVPEPSTWSIILLGFGGLGLARYRASRKSVAVTA